MQQSRENLTNESGELYKWEKPPVPYVYIAIQYYHISKEDFIAANEKMQQPGLDSYGYYLPLEAWMIDALYCGDEKQMRQTLLSPYALYSEVKDEIYLFSDIRGISQWMLYSGEGLGEAEPMSTEELYDLGFTYEIMNDYFIKIQESLKADSPNNYEAKWEDFNIRYHLTDTLEELKLLATTAE